MKTKLIDTTKQPKSRLEGWTIESHDTSLGKINPRDIKLWLSEKQKTSYQTGSDLYDEVKVQSPLNACVLDYLLKNPKEIPEEWKGQYVYFWGTILRSPSGDRYVLCLYWNDGAWDWRVLWLDGDWDAGGPSAVLATKSSETKTSDSLPLDLSSAIKVCKDAGYKVIKEC